LQFPGLPAQTTAPRSGLTGFAVQAAVWLPESAFTPLFKIIAALGLPEEAGPAAARYFSTKHKQSPPFQAVYQNKYNVRQTTAT
jgi:hypothetical protein